MSDDKRTGAERIAAERARQSARYDRLHDGIHNRKGQLARAAVCYASPDEIYRKRDFAMGTTYEDPWPWAPSQDKRPHNGNVLDRSKQTMAERIRELEKAGALIAAEIDRLLRLVESGGNHRT